MTNILLLFICLIIGLLFQRIKALPKDAHLTLNILILHIPVPALALLTVPNLIWDLGLISLIAVPWIIFILSWIFFHQLGKKFNWTASLTGCLILTAGLGNTAFVGFPVIEALYGKENLKLALLLDQSGSFLIVSSLGIYVAALYSSGKLQAHHLAKKVLSFPPFIAFTTALILGAFGWRAEGDIKTILEKLAAILTPLALISVGLQLKWREGKEHFKYLCIGLGYKLFLAPVVIFSILYFFNLPTIYFKVAVMEAAMAPMITAGIVASSHNLEPRLAGMMIGVGVPLSFLTLGFWYLLV